MKSQGISRVLRLLCNHRGPRVTERKHFYTSSQCLYLGEMNMTSLSLNDYINSFNLVTHVVEPWAKRQPDHLVLLLTDGLKNTRLTYSELLEESESLAKGLSHKKENSPTCALVILPKVIPWWIINVAGSLCDMIISPATLMLSEREILRRINMCQADAIFCCSSVMNKVHYDTQHLPWRVLVENSMEKELKNLRDGWISYHQLVSEGRTMQPIHRTYKGDSIAQIFFTSGTTGEPKMVPHTQAGYGIGMETAARDWLDLKPDDVIWNISDLGWAKAAYSSLYAPLISGSTIFAHQNPRFEVEDFIKSLEEFPVSVLCLPATALRLLIQEDLSTFKPMKLRKCVSGGEHINPEVMKLWKKYTGITIQEGYGQSESTLSCSSANGVKVKPGSFGKPVHGYDIKIVDQDLKELGPHEVGEIAYSLKNGWPYGLFKGYLNAPEQNAKVFVNGYYLTGDKAFMDEEGYLFFVGRNDDIIKTSGYKVSPYEVESVLLEHPAILESGVVASLDETRGSVIKAFIVLNEKNKWKIETEERKAEMEKEIKEFVKKTTAPYKYPRKIEFVDSLPKTVSGKIRRVELRAKEVQI